MAKAVLFPTKFQYIISYPVKNNYHFPKSGHPNDDMTIWLKPSLILLAQKQPFVITSLPVRRSRLSTHRQGRHLYATTFAFILSTHLGGTSMENAFHGISAVFHILDKCCFCLLPLLFKTNQAYDFDKA